MQTITATYHRIESPTQTVADASQQEMTLEIWGKPARSSDIPKVKAYKGPLPPGAKGIQFETDVLPDPCSPPNHAFWSVGREGVERRQVESGQEFAIIRATRVINSQRQSPLI